MPTTTETGQGEDRGAGKPWRVGSHYGIHVYAGDRPVATFHRSEDAAHAVFAATALAASGSTVTGEGVLMARLREQVGEPLLERIGDAWAYGPHGTVNIRLGVEEARSLLLAAAPQPGPDAREDGQAAPEKPSLFLEGHLNDLCLAGEHPVQRERRTQAPDPAPRSQADAGALEDLAGLSAKAYRGPWSVYGDGRDGWIAGPESEDEGDVVAECPEYGCDKSRARFPANAAFIVALVNAYRSGFLAPRSDRPLSAAPGGEREAIHAVAEAWAGIDGKDDHFRRERDEGIRLTDPTCTGHYAGYLAEAEELIVRIRRCGFDILALAQTPALRSGEALERIRHVKSGGVYEVLCADAQVQTDTPLGDYAKVGVYRGVEPPHLTWVRPIAEMEDGRFEPVAPPTAPAAEEAQR